LTPFQSIVSITGIAIDAELVVDSSSPEGVKTLEINQTNIQKDGERNTLVVPINFSNRQFTENASSLTDKFFGSINSVNTYYLEVTRGSTWFSGTVISPITIPYRFDDCTADYYNWEHAVEQELLILQYDLSIYDNIYGFVPSNNCYNGSHAYVGDKWAFSYGTDGLNRMTIIHEIGHNLGLLHANALDCDVKILALMMSVIN